MTGGVPQDILGSDLVMLLSSWKSHLPTKLTPMLHKAATEINGKALSDSQEFLPGLRLPPEMPAHPLP